MLKCEINKVAKQLYWNHTSAWEFSCIFASYFQNTFSYEHVWSAASILPYFCKLFQVSWYIKELILFLSILFLFSLFQTTFIHLEGYHLPLNLIFSLYYQMHYLNGMYLLHQSAWFFSSFYFNPIFHISLPNPWSNLSFHPSS